MDPNQAYLDLCQAMNSGDLATARERALALKEWFSRGGFYPQQLTPEAMNATIADILRQTSLAEAGVAFSLTCERCDAGMEIHSYVEAVAAGWTGIEFSPDLPNANYVGTCPDCREAGE